jgi:DNA-binding FrmR family transcriptional regulator
MSGWHSLSRPFIVLEQPLFSNLLCFCIRYAQIEALEDGKMKTVKLPSGSGYLQNPQQKEQLHRIHRIQGQLASLAELLEQDNGSCEDYVIRARTIEKGMSSLINNFIICQTIEMLQSANLIEPDDLETKLARLLKILKK